MAASISVLTENEDSTDRWYVYVIENRLGQYYTGITTDPNRRLRQHSGELKGGARALKGKGPLQFRLILSVCDRSQALKTEYAIKQLSKREKLALVQEDLRALTLQQVEIVTERFC